MKKKIVSTWYFEQDIEFGGYYPQNSGPAHSENFRDTYRRCIYIFFASAAKSNPDARLVLFLNCEWKTNSSKVSKEVAKGLVQLGVEIVVIPFTFHAKSPVNLWKNQFFVLDVIKYAYLNWSSQNLLLILDSDIIWNPTVKSEKFWKELSDYGLLTYEIEYNIFEKINGLSRIDLTEISKEIEPRNTTNLSYYGGEFIALDMINIHKIFTRIEKDWVVHLSRANEGLPTFTEEAHFLSHIFSVLTIPRGDASHFVKRIWTMFAKYRNTSHSDKRILLLHVPAEKNYGIRRLYKKSIKEDRFSAGFNFSAIGIPKNSIFKTLRDIAWAVLRRVRKNIIYLRLSNFLREILPK